MTTVETATAVLCYAFIGESRTVDVHINRLRRKLGLQNDIQTVYKVGYRLSSAN